MSTLKKNGKTGKTSDQLDRALMEVTNIFERAVCPFFLLGETARSIIKDGALKGKVIELGVIDKHLTKEALSALNMVLSDMALLLDDWEIQKKGWGTKHFIKRRDKASKIRFRAEHIPVLVKVIRKKSKYLDNLDNVVYNFDDYKIPNPFDGYWKVRGLI